MRLSKFQERFKETMLQPVSALDDVDAELRSLFVDNDISVENRLKVYQNNIVGSVSASLAATFPILEKLVGEDFLKSMARAFVFEHPPTSGCMHSYGVGFDDFIRTYEPAKSLPYLSDVATLELAINTAYYAADDTPMAADALSRIPEDALGDVILKLRASAILVHSDYPLMQIKDFCEDEDHYDAPDLTQSFDTLLLLYRPDLDVQIMSLDKDEFFIMQQFFDGLSLAVAIDKTLEHYPAFDFTIFLKKFIYLETFSTL